MRRSILKLLVASYVEWLRGKFPPVDQPCLHDFEARASVIVDAVTQGIDDSPIEFLDGDGVRVGLELILGNLAAAHKSDSWAIAAIACLRLLARGAEADILDAINKRVISTATSAS